MTNITTFAQNTAYYVLSTPFLRNGLGVAVSAHAARAFNGPLTGLLVAVSECVALSKYSDQPIPSIVAGLSFYYTPKAIEVTVQRVFSETGFWAAKTIGKGTLYLTAYAGTLTLQAASASWQKIKSIKTLEKAPVLEATSQNNELEELKTEKKTLQRKVKQLTRNQMPTRTSKRLAEKKLSHEKSAPAEIRKPKAHSKKHNLH
jgi:hypothetical protein